jgi:two-component system chemotaxis response regulator CheY
LIRSDSGLAETPICVITTEGAKDDRARAIALGANEYLTKPIQANKVLSIARDLLKLPA